jgi:hypothetical protein
MNTEMNTARMNTARATVTAIATAGLLTTSAVAGAWASAASRPSTEHVPTAIHTAEVLYDGGASGGASAHLVKGGAATRLITLFNALKLEPRNTIHCDIAGGPTTIVSFKGAHHLWKATQSACTNVQVTRDGKGLPTLLATRAWTNAVRKDLAS